MHDLVLVGKAFSEPTRVRIIAALAQTECCVCELCDALEISQSTLSTHLQVIREAGLVSTRKEGKWVYYALEPVQLEIVTALLNRYQASLATEPRLRRDAARLNQRLAIREQGRCTLGFAQLDFTSRGGDNHEKISATG